MKRSPWIALFAVVAGCATTYNEAAQPTTTVAATTTVPAGDFSALLNLMRDQFATLADEMSTTNRDGARRALEEIELLWTAMQTHLTDRGRQFTEDLRRIVEFATTSVTRNRPADADKGLRFIDLLISAEATGS